MQKQKQTDVKAKAKGKTVFAGSTEIKTAASKGRKLLKAKFNPKIEMPKVLRPKSGMTLKFKKGVIEALYSGKYKKIEGALSMGGNHVCVMGAIGHEYAKSKGKKFGNISKMFPLSHILGREHAIGAAVGIPADKVSKLVRMNDHSIGVDNFKALANYINKNL